VIHRDLKHSNVLVAESDEGPVPKIIDFGIAKVLDDDREPEARLTQEFQLLGSPSYMSPEQASGSRDLDVRTDVYSLGVLLYQLISGRTPISNP
jgi:serine/threonine protein kinase